MVNTPVAVTYSFAHVDIPQDFLRAAPDETPTFTPVDFVAVKLPEYKDCIAAVVDNALSAAECEKLVHLAEASVPRAADGTEHVSWKPAMVAVGPGMEALAPGYRESDRIVWDHQDVVDRIWARLAQAEGLTALLASVTEDYTGDTWTLKRVNQRMRFLKYSRGQFFKPHCDSSFSMREDGKNLQTFYTIQLYLNDSAEANPNADLTGGATTIVSRDRKRRYGVDPKAGRAFIFQHRMLLHEGAEVGSGTKFAVRMDVLYE